jgi:membrane fusion protein (multidrug efflux system)
MSRYVQALAMAASVAAAQSCGQAEPAPAPPAPPTVSVVELRPETVPIVSEWTATLDGYVNAQIRPQVSGYLVAMRYREGALVRKGDVLFEIDARPFDAALAQAEAQLALAQAQLGRAERDVARSTPLARERAIPQSQLDNDIQGQLAADASVKAARAAVDTARLNVEFTKVRSLVDGVAAIATAQIGDLVGPTTLLTTVSQVDPMRAYFSLSEREYLAIADQVNKPSSPRGLWNTGRDLQLRLADGSEYPQRGTFLAADRQIDPGTGTIRISAAFPNPSRTLRPGQYGRVQATTRIVENALLVPQRAVTELQGSAQVRVVDAGSRLQVVNVTLGGRSGNRWVITDGLEPGARVALDAPQIRPDTVVQTRPYVAEGESQSAAPAEPAAPVAPASPAGERK